MQSFTNNTGIYLQSICCKETEVFFPVVLQPNVGHGPSFLKFLDHTWWHITIVRTPVDEWSAGHRDLYLTPHSTQQMSMSPVWFEPTILAGKWLQVYAFKCTATMADAPWGARPHPIVCRLSICVGLCGWWPHVFFPYVCRRAPFWGLRQMYMNECKVDQWLWWQSIAAHGDPVREHGGGSLRRDSEGKIKRDILSER